MNTIKIFLGADGSTISLQKDFQLYQYEYQNKLLNVYVPTSICAGPFVDDNVTTGYSCQIKMSAVNAYGQPKLTGNFYMRIVGTTNGAKKVTVGGVEYYIFERLLPYAFSIYSGTGINAPQLSVSVVNMTYENSQATVLSIVNTQTCPLEIMPSTQVQTEVPEDPDDIDTLFGLYSTLQTNIALKQNADTTNDTDVINPSGSNHTVVKNINDNREDIDDLDNYVRGEDGLADQVDKNTEDIANLKILSVFGLNLVGTYKITSTSVGDNNRTPTKSELDTYILSQTGDTQVNKGDGCFVYWDNYQAEDKNAIFFWNGTQYSEIVMNLIRDAENGTLGLIQGTYSLAGESVANNLMIDVLDGKIINIYRIDASGNKIDIKKTMDEAYDKFVALNPVDKANKDGDGNNIKSTYQTKADGATKIYVQQYASPKALYDINYADYNGSEFKDENVSDTSYQKTTTSTQIGDTTLAILTMNTKADILLGDQNGCGNKIWINSTLSESVKLFVITQYTDSDNVVQTLSSELSETIALVANTPKLVQVDSVFDGLTTPITLPQGTEIAQTIKVRRESSTSCDFTLLSSTTYMSYMTLNKIGFVKYSLAYEPSYFENGTGTIVDAGSYLRVRGTGKMEYENGGESNFQTQLNLPVATSLNGSEVTPPKTKVVYNALLAKQDQVTIDTTATSPITLAHNTSFRLGTVSSTLTLVAPSSYPLDFECEVVFTADTGITLTYPTVIAQWTGDDVDSQGDFVEQIGKTYNILFFNNATAVGTPSIQAIVRGV